MGDFEQCGICEAEYSAPGNRRFHSQTNCCLDCGPNWDKLSVAEKEAKLSKVSSKSVWTCSMHPQIRQPQPGKCPLCSMKLIPAAESHEKAADSSNGRHDQESHDDHAGHTH